MSFVTWTSYRGMLTLSVLTKLAFFSLLSTRGTNTILFMGVGLDDLTSI